MPSITTGAHIMARAKRQLNEPTGTDEGFWSDADYMNCINEAQEDFVLKTKCLKTYATFATDGTNKEYCIDETALANFMDISEVWFFYAASTTIYRPLIRVSRDELVQKESYLRNISADPAYYCYEDRIIEFDTIPDSGDTCRIYYFKMPAVPAEATTALNLAETPDIPNRFHPALVYYVCWKFTEADDSVSDKLIYFQQKYAELVGQAMVIEDPAASSYPHIKDAGDMPYV